MAAVYGAQSGTSTTRRSTSPSAIATPRPNSAVSSGRPIATTEPKVISRMSAAASRPMPSEPMATVCALVATGPPTSTCRRVVTGGQDGLDQCRGLVGRELVGRPVEGDVGVRRRGVRGDLLRAVRASTG